MYLFQSTLPRGERSICFVVTRPRYRVSIHAPTRGETLQPQLLTNLLPGFNPRSHVGSDFIIAYALLPKELFQSTLPREERPIFQSLLNARLRFQSTLPRGERPRKNLPIYLSVCFNPRSHVGSDRYAHNKLSNMQLSM